MIPLTLIPIGEEAIIRRVGGNTVTRRHLESMGFCQDGEVCIVSNMGDNLIVRVKQTRVAVSREMALKIYADSAKEGRI